jgi:uncharacterized protein (TIGR02996 family)
MTPTSSFDFFAIFEEPLPRSLLDGVIADPDDDLPRLALADWCLEQDDLMVAGFGEYVQNCIAFYHVHDDHFLCGEPSCECRRFHDQSEMLLARYEFVWHRRGSDYRQWAFWARTMERGFWSVVRTGMRDWLKNGPDILRWQPITCINLYGHPLIPGDLYALLQHETLAKVQEVWFDEMQLSDRWIDRNGHLLPSGQTIYFHSGDESVRHLQLADGTYAFHSP